MNIIISSFLTIVIGITGATILVLQYLLARRRWRLDLYEKRYPVFLSARDFLKDVLSSRNVADEALTNLARNSQDFEFLFGEEIKTYLDELYREGLKLQVLTNRLQRTKGEKERDKVITQIQQLIDWFDRQYESSSKLFGSYLRIDKK